MLHAAQPRQATAALPLHLLLLLGEGNAGTPLPALPLEGPSHGEDEPMPLRLAWYGPAPAETLVRGGRCWGWRKSSEGPQGWLARRYPEEEFGLSAAGTSPWGQQRENICWKESGCLGLSALGCCCKCLRKQMFLANSRISRTRDSLLSLQPHKAVVNVKHMPKPQPASGRAAHALN